MALAGVFNFGNATRSRRSPMNPPGPELLGQLLDGHLPALTLLARRWCGAPEDVVQEAFFELARQREWPKDPAAWLYRVVRNGAISAGQAETRRRRHETAAAAIARGWFADSPDVTIDAQAAAAALANLDRERRDVIVAHVWGGLSFSQIAEVLDSSTSAVHRKYQSGLATLRDLIGEVCRPTDSKKNCPTD
jgi:RNA polymerase sigma-70 factor (ECF subfamily)